MSKLIKPAREHIKNQEFYGNGIFDDPDHEIEDDIVYLMETFAIKILKEFGFKKDEVTKLKETIGSNAPYSFSKSRILLIMSSLSN